MTEYEKELIKEAEDRKAVYVEKKLPTRFDSDSVWFWIYFTDRQHYVAYRKCIYSNNVKHYELFDRLEFNKEYLLKDLKIGMHQEQLDI